MDWEDYNYPPCLRIIHYQLSDVEAPDASAAVWWAHVSYVGVVVSLTLNIVTTVMLAGGVVPDKGVDIFYSIFNFVIVVVVGMYSFYNGYKGIATNNMRLSFRYVVIQGLMLVFILLAFLLGSGPFNGVTGIKRARDFGGDVGEMWFILTVIESTLWGLNLGVGAYGLYRVSMNRKHGRPSSSFAIA